MRHADKSHYASFEYTITILLLLLFVRYVRERMDLEQACVLGCLFSGI